MGEKNGRKGRKSLTEGIGIGENAAGKVARRPAVNTDPRIVGLVRLLARKAADRDFARLVHRNGATRPEPRED